MPVATNGHHVHSTSEPIEVQPASIWNAAGEKLLMAPYEHFKTTKGSGLRAQIYAAANEYYEVPPKELEIIMEINYLIGAWIILLDDIEDGSELRRGQPASHKIYGVPQTINSAGYLFLVAMEKIAELQALHPEANLNAMFIDEMKYVHRGQGLEMLWRDTLKCPTEAESIDMMNKKTTSFFRLIVRLMHVCASRNKEIDFVPLVDLTGVYLQIWNDYTDVCTGGKGDDFTEGKFTFPIQHAHNLDPENPFITYTLSQRSEMPQLRQKALKYIREETRSTEYTYARMQQFQKQIREEVNKIGGSKTLMKLVDGVIESLPPS
ncbi:geranylgeranyl pyrophosphate synthetase [Moniliophthora roreri MCA 2997]|uniref:(2E,6E)-farnesyl diphosphate synthase n=1 Tax=Moniliophthora roreri (strain MCA 2997) TaxID=1381753 RepID=V2XRA2_MONRO|nr:geranylgeranyl pyrophosphate synthetase [Moniliophthora roreri MCA 2997]